MKPKSVRSKFRVPIYNDVVHMAIGDIKTEHNRLKKYFGEYDEGEGPDDGECVYDTSDGRFGLFLSNKAPLSHNTIAHEAYHLTNRILHRHNALPSGDKDEHGALLAGYIAEKVYALRDKM